MNSAIEFVDPADESIGKYTFAIILAKYQGKWLMVRHRDRDTWELPAGHVEAGETADEAAERELVEETGALEFNIEPLVSYKGILKGRVIYGKLFKADVFLLGDLPDYEIAEVKSFAKIPKNLTYPEIQPVFINWFIANGG